MEPTLTAIAAFLSPFLFKAGEKVAEESVKTLFESRRDLADKFKGLFREDIISLGLNDASSPATVMQQLEADSGIKEGLEAKVQMHRELMDQLTEALSKQEGSKITCHTYIDKIEHIENAHFN